MRESSLTGADAREIVQGRVCGTCTVCCSVLPIDTPELQKLPGVTCVHCTDRGCGISASWPPICRDYFCGWRMLAEFGDAWRPDRSGVLLTPIDDRVPAYFTTRQGIEFMVVDRKAALEGDRLADALLHFVRRGLAAYLSIPGPTGHYATRVLLNDALAAAAKANDWELAKRTIVRILDASRDHVFERVVLKSAPSR